MPGADKGQVAQNTHQGDRRCHLRARSSQRNRTANVQSIGRHDTSGLLSPTRADGTRDRLCTVQLPLFSVAWLFHSSIENARRVKIRNRPLLRGARYSTCTELRRGRREMRQAPQISRREWPQRVRPRLALMRKDCGGGIVDFIRFSAFSPERLEAGPGCLNASRKGLRNVI